MISLLLCACLQAVPDAIKEPIFVGGEAVYMDHTRTKINAIVRHEGCLDWGPSDDKAGMVCYEPRYVDVWTLDQTHIRIDRLTKEVTVRKRGSK